MTDKSKHGSLEIEAVMSKHSNKQVSQQGSQNLPPTSSPVMVPVATSPVIVQAPSIHNLPSSR